MKREDIEKILKNVGIAEDKIKTTVDSIMAENGKDIEAEKTKTSAEIEKLNKANETIKGLQSGIKKFDGVDVEGLKKSAKDWEDKYKTDIATEQAKSKKLEQTYKLKEALAEVGATDPDYVIFKHGGVEKFTFNDDNRIIGLDDTIKAFKETNPTQFKDVQMMKVNSGGVHGGLGGAEPTTMRSALAEKYKQD